MTFERRITKKMFRTTKKDDGYWRIKINQEINHILEEQSVILFIKKNKD